MWNWFSKLLIKLTAKDIKAGSLIQHGLFSIVTFKNSKLSKHNGLYQFYDLENMLLFQISVFKTSDDFDIEKQLLETEKSFPSSKLITIGRNRFIVNATSKNDEQNLTYVFRTGKGNLHFLITAISFGYLTDEKKTISWNTTVEWLKGLTIKELN